MAGVTHDPPIPVTEQGNQERSILVLPNLPNERNRLLSNYQQQQQITEQQERCPNKKVYVFGAIAIAWFLFVVLAIVTPLMVTNKCDSTTTTPVYSFKTALINNTDIVSACGEPTLLPDKFTEQHVHLYQSECSFLKWYNTTLAPPAELEPVKNRIDPLPLFFEFLSNGSTVKVELNVTLENKGTDIPVCTFDDVKRLREELDLTSGKKWDRSYALHCSYIGGLSQTVLNWRETIRFNKTSYYVIVIYPLHTLELINYTYAGWTYALNYSDYAYRELDCSAPKGCSSNTSCVIATADPAGSPLDFVDVQIQPPKWNKYTILSLTVGLIGILACIVVIFTSARQLC